MTRLIFKEVVRRCFGQYVTIGHVSLPLSVSYLFIYYLNDGFIFFWVFSE